jgi:ArsR family transcriptional regulator
MPRTAALKPRTGRPGKTAPAKRRATPHPRAIVKSVADKLPLTTGALFELLSDATRRRLLVLLLDEREICVCRLVDALDHSQPKISRHLAVLRDAGVLVSRRQRTWIMYRLNSQLPGWAVRIIAMLSEGAHHEPETAADRKRLAHARRCGEIGFP